jgi:signal peptidase I
VARVVAAGGSTIEMRQGEVWLNGKRLEEPWLPEVPITTTTINGQTIQLPESSIKSDLRPLQIPEQHYFVLGDNRGNSSDSRDWGLVPHELIIGVYERPQ